ncbi:MAG TPA: acyltransferase family protein [Gemmatimonadaceae bacterium]|nr:acyltransferase family protein [Gemmatimonadaceae bacterium]
MTVPEREPKTPADPARKEGFRPDIEGLRAIAILLVVAFHVGVPGLRGGFVGVDVFFVLSGYLITGLLVKELRKTGELRILNFYGRRIRRLLPAVAVMILVVVVAVSTLLSPDERELYSRAAFAAGAYASNIWFQITSSDYFSPAIEGNPFLHTWSLAVEEQFYLVWPLLLLLTFRISRSTRALATVMIALSSVSFAAGLWMTAHAPQAAFFSSPARAWEFGIGGLVALAPGMNLARFAKIAGALGVMGLLTLLAGAVVFASDAPFPGSRALVPVLGTAAMLISGVTTSPMGGVRRILTARPFQYIGRLSYSWYLWHWPVLVLGAVMVPSLGLAGRAALALAALGIAAVSYSMIEAPIRFSGYLAVRPLATLGLGAAITLGTMGASRFAKISAIAAANTPEQRVIDIARAPAGAELTASGCFLKREDTDLRDCAFGDRTAPTTIVLFGDSHAAQWFSAFEAVATRHQWRLIDFTKMGCPSPNVDVRLWSIKQTPYPECSLWRNAALQRIVELKPALVILSNSDSHVTPAWSTGSPRLSLMEWTDGMRKTLMILDSAGINAVILHDTPGPRFDVPTCLSRAAVRRGSAQSCEAPRVLAIREDVFQAAKEAATGLAHASWLDLTDDFCGPVVCPAVLGGTIVYGQPGHISHVFARAMADTIAQRILPIVIHQMRTQRAEMRRRTFD